MSGKELNYGIVVLLEFYREKRRELASDLYSIVGKYSENVKIKDVKIGIQNAYKSFETEVLGMDTE
ncbi:hypothetical protein [Aneurinibacillus danicus]|jgi:hypothetical protein|uniref:Uncharacterized protein n=1 Tax=Aneurinibacillus danicus TaxID=267746 RepID=A0A511V8V8_9BACL|nr:hypothetical protein [Aneurinibacillus danicus]GEN34651.1 hypothetical protein ADA01nite_21110 [Aneurinibacillus danicus]